MPIRGKQQEQKRGRHAADMTIQPTEWRYEPPDLSICDEQVYPVLLDDEGLVQYVYAMRLYRKQTVHFSVEIQARDHSLADWQVIYRIDTSHGTVHEHEFAQGDETGESKQMGRTVLATIPADDSWRFVDNWLVKAMDLCDTSWQKHLERWQR